ncbi:glycosyltransferase family 4 protein [Haliangium sp. UPWRP_2]|uniref:glycosyltransferase family 4 protein n=1 Tax=Haliangium sp. UPWRP_2 TaxID=1931276 RepID=UPI000B53BE43|nr:glycosyltransferase family 4 protein [Haliangium sp. UPWRP_2]PSM32419.1 hypothetical protein BVG81_000465 [Haliangium sp. UPWRP_2]HNN92370.1 glycosyltransferase family 4 protein [Pseudomonadota bacterium]
MLIVLSTLSGAYGGIPAFNRLLCETAADDAAARRQPLSVLALTDALGTTEPAFHYTPCGGDRGRLIREYLRVLWLSDGRFSRPLLLGHVNLAPLALSWPGPVGVIAHGSEVFSPLPPLRRLSLQRANVVACVSDYTADCVRRQQGVNTERIVRVVNALPGLPPLSKAASDTSGPLRLLAIARLHPDEKKGIDALLHALSRLPKDDFALTVIGEGPDLPRLRALSVQLGVSPRVRFLGAVSNAVRDAELTACQVFALPSALEGFGIVYLEALAHGKPCLAARAGGAPEIVRDGETGLLCPVPVEENLAALCHALSRLRDPGLRQRLADRGRAHVAQHHSRAAFVAAAHALFARLQH